jgi:hypothetical protein
LGIGLLATATWASDQVASPAEVIEHRSRHFLVQTDLPASEAKVLAERMEATLSFAVKHWGRPPGEPIRCFVVRDLDGWSGETLDAVAREKIAQRAGLTLTDTLLRGERKLSARPVIYASASGDAARHEVIHAYLEQNFASQGPPWHAEGMAEVGRFGTPGDPAVRCPAWLVKHLRTQPAPSVAQVVSDRVASGGSWQQYAWRWALCHLLLHNPNYCDRFQSYSRRVVAGHNERFADVLGPHAPRLEFEYRQFVGQIESGYRVDLCAWDWRASWSSPGQDGAGATVHAGRGWQPSGVLVEAGRGYRYSASGKWTLAADGAKLDADGQRDGSGRLIGVIYHDDRLSKPVTLGTAGTFTAPAAGRLYLRCADAWGSLADNVGSVSVRIEPTEPEAAPRRDSNSAATSK